MTGFTASRHMNLSHLLTFNELKKEKRNYIVDLYFEQGRIDPGGVAQLLHKIALSEIHLL